MSPFGYSSIQLYLQAFLKGPGRRRGTRSLLAKAARCQSSYLSRVLAGRSRLSLDQAKRIADYLGLMRDEWEYLRELAILDISASSTLREDCLARMDRMRNRDAHERLVRGESLGG